MLQDTDLVPFDGGGGAIFEGLHCCIDGHRREPVHHVGSVLVAVETAQLTTGTLVINQQDLRRPKTSGHMTLW